MSKMVNFRAKSEKRKNFHQPMTVYEPSNRLKFNIYKTALKRLVSRQEIKIRKIMESGSLPNFAKAI